MFNKAPTTDRENAETDREDDELNFLKPGDSPVFLTALYFVNRSAKAYFNNMFNFMLQDNPRVGNGSSTFGQLSTWGPERGFEMDLKLRELENGGFKEKERIQAIHDSPQRN